MVKLTMGNGMEDYACIECGDAALESYTEMGDKKIIKIAHCKTCKCAVDKYIEYDPVIIYLDAILLKIPVYRHILINDKQTNLWKLALLLLFCDAFTKWMLQKSENIEHRLEPNRVFYAALEVDLYWNFCLSVLQWLTHILVIMFLMIFCERWGSKRTSRKYILKAVVISNFGKVLVIPALLWGQTYSIIYLRLGQLFVLASNIQALRVVKSHHIQTLQLIVIVGLATFCKEIVLFVLPSSEKSIQL